MTLVIFVGKLTTLGPMFLMGDCAVIIVRRGAALALQILQILRSRAVIERTDTQATINCVSDPVSRPWIHSDSHHWWPRI